MSETADTLSVLDLLIGVLLVLAIMLKAGFERIGAPSLVTFLILGVVLSASDQQFELISEDGKIVFEFLASIGVIALLFRVGLDSNLHGLVKKLAPALPIWFGNVVLSGVPGYVVAHHLLGFALIPSLFAATALTATSRAVSLEVWREAGALDTDAGEILTDVAGLDDVSGIALMGLLLAVVSFATIGEDPNSRATYASPPYFMHELDPSYLGLMLNRDDRSADEGPADPDTSNKTDAT